VVFLAGIEQGYVPIGQASTPEQISEELRLLYVAVTRAERELHCSWSGQRTFGERVASRQPSQWLASIEVAISAMRAGAEPLDWRAALAQARAVVDSANENAGRSKPGSKGRTRSRIDDDADPLLAALKSWRRTTSQAAAVPAYVIFSDATLIEIAKRRPRNEQSLLKVSGVGQVKASRWGDAVLQIVRDQPAIVATTGA
jgi:DNA helicase-2/ATP-dependent DNA helicase PcrA